MNLGVTDIPVSQFLVVILLLVLKLVHRCLEDVQVDSQVFTSSVELAYPCPVECPDSPVPCGTFPVSGR